MNTINRKVTGFSLVELIIALLIGVLLLAWGIPNWRDLKIRSALTDNSNEIAYSLNLARAEAVRYGRIVTVSPITAGDWSDGWTISTSGIEGAADIQIYEHNPIGDQFTISQVGPLQGDLQFNSLGGLVGNSEGALTLVHIDSTAFRIIRTRLTGLSKVETS